MLTYLPGTLLGIAIVLALATALPKRPALRDVLAAPYRDPKAHSDDASFSSPLARAGRGAVPLLTTLGLPHAARLRDLRLLDRSPAEHLATQAACAGVAAIFGLGYPAILQFGGIKLATSLIVGTTLLFAPLGFVLPDRSVRAEAEQVREHLRHATSAFLDLSAVMLAAGAGLEESLICAAEPGQGPGHDHLRTALAVARTGRKPLWETLGQLGEHADIPDLTELAACASLAGTEGARIRATLTAKSTALRTRLLAEQEAQAAAATERAAVPTTLLMAGYVLLVTFPAVAQALHGL